VQRLSTLTFGLVSALAWAAIPSAHAQSYPLIDDLAVTSVTAEYGLDGGGARALRGTVSLTSFPVCSTPTEDPAPFPVSHTLYAWDGVTLDTLALGNQNFEGCGPLFFPNAWSFGIDAARQAFIDAHSGATWDWYVEAVVDDSGQVGPDPGNNSQVAYVTRRFLENVGVASHTAGLTGDVNGLAREVTIDGRVTFASSPTCSPVVFNGTPLPYTLRLVATPLGGGAIDDIELYSGALSGCGDLEFGLDYAVDLSGPLRDFAVDHDASGWTWSVSFEVDDTGLGGGAVPIDNFATAFIPQSFLPLSGRIWSGAPGASVEGRFTRFRRAALGLCGAGQVYVDALSSFEWIPSPSTGAFIGLPVEGMNYCASYVPTGADGYDLVAAGTLPAEAEGEVFGQTKRFDVRLTSTGIRILDLEVDLPGDVSLHSARATAMMDRFGAPLPEPVETPHPRGNPSLYIGFVPTMTSAPWFIANDTLDLSRLELVPSTGAFYVRSGGSPLSVRVDPALAVTLWPVESLLTAGVQSVAYLRQPAYNALDPRWTQPAPSNDVHLARARPDPSAPTVVLSGDGVQFQGQVLDPLVGRTYAAHFPELRRTWNAHILQTGPAPGLFGAGPVPDAVGLEDRFQLSLATGCPGCGGVGATVAYDLRAADVSLSEDGALAAAVSGLQNPAWGPPVALPAGGTVPVFRRTGDSGAAGVLLLPGHLLPGTAIADAFATASAPQVLMGMRALRADLAPSISSPLGTTVAGLGNGFASGLNVGPEVYAGPAGPAVLRGANLSGTETRIAFVGAGGVRADAALTSNLGTKYVVRTGGLTGVFNFTGLPAPVPQISGYATTFSRFAFRMWANQLDTESWIDGRVEVGGPASFDVSLASMGLECTGQMGAGTVVDDGDVEQLAAWKTPYLIRSAAFVPVTAAAGVCSGDARTLRVGGNIVPAALTKRLDLEANWSTAGLASAVVLTGDTVNELDRTGPAKAGFTLQLDKDVKLGLNAAGNGNGHFAFNGRFSVPFWNAIDAGARLQNSALPEGTATPTGAPSVVYDPSKVAEISGEDNNTTLASQVSSTGPDGKKYQVRAKYEWVPGFTMDLPVFYAGKKDGTGAPEFLGQPQSEKLVVMELKQGVDFIRTENTKVSFGASANLDKLRLSDAVLNIDLNDPTTVQRADSWLNALGVSGTPIQTIVGSIKAPGDLLMKYVGPGVQDLIRMALRTFLNELRPTIKAVTDKLNFVQSLPGQVTDAVFGAAQAELSKALGQLSTPIDNAFCTAHDTTSAAIAQFVFDARTGATSSGATALGAAEAEAARVARAIVRPVRDAVNAASTALSTIQGALNTANETLSNIHSAANTGITQAEGVIDALNGTLTNLASNPLLQCNAGDPKSNPMFGAVYGVLEAAESFVTALASQTLQSIVSALGGPVGLDTSRFQAAQSSIASAAKAVFAPVKTAIDNVVAQVCKLKTKFEQATATAAALLKSAKTAMNDVKIPLNALLDPSVGSGSLASTLKAFAAGAFGKVATGLAALDKQLTELDNALVAFSTAGTSYAAIYGALPPEIQALDTQPKVQAYLQSAVKAAVPAYAGLGLCAPGGARPMALVTNEINVVVGGFLGDLAAKVNKELSGLLSALPFPTPDTLINLLEREVFNSDVVGQLDKLVHDNLTLLAKGLNDLGQQFFQHVNGVLKEASEKFNAMLQGLIAQAQGVLDQIPVRGAKLDGYAIINARELERLHVGAEFTFGSKKSGDTTAENKDSQSTFSAALDVTSWAVNGKGKGCISDGGTTDELPGAGILDASITARDLPISIGPGNLRLTLLGLSFTLEKVGSFVAPVGLAGTIQTVGALSFGSFKLMNIGLEAGAGKYENYLGAKCAASFQGVDIEAAFLAGKTCNGDVLGRLDKEAADFITLPGGIFQGAYARGKASIPIITGGCALTVGAGVDVGFWVLAAKGIVNVGGILGGSAFGEALCVVGLRGGIQLMAEVYDGDFRFRGKGYGVGGFGFDCDPETWTTVERSRDDDWCWTGDAQLVAEYKGKFEIKNVSVDGVF
jgi:hypothetical protein